MRAVFFIRGKSAASVRSPWPNNENSPLYGEVEGTLSAFEMRVPLRKVPESFLCFFFFVSAFLLPAKRVKAAVFVYRRSSNSGTFMPSFVYTHARTLAFSEQ